MAPEAPDAEPRPAPAAPASRARGAARLATEATTGLVDLVEAMHARIQRLPGLPPPTHPDRTSGLTGLVYRSIRGVTRLVGGSVDSLLGALAPLLAPALASADDLPEREALLAALNGVLGDYLARTSNPLATPMTWRREGRALPDEAPALAAAVADAGPRLLVMIHGLCMNDRQWPGAGVDYARSLADELGFTPVHLRYNTGLHVSENGRALAEALERLVDAWPRPLARVALLCHSMGGLLARSAVHQGRQAGHRWVPQLTDLVCLGTPHHGAPLERAGNVFDRVLGAAPYAAPLARLGRLRSAGITDLRHGNLLEEDWSGHDRFDGGPDRRHHLPLPDQVNCAAVAAVLGDEPGALKGRLLGDGLVPLDSALGRHRDPARCLSFPDDRQWVAHGLHHFDLLHHPEVLARLRDWLGGAAPAGRRPVDH